MDELTLLERMAPYVAGEGGGVLVGHGDDAAVLSFGRLDVCVTVDLLIDAVHVDRTVSTLADIGWKAVAVNVSDLAAMGARPTAAVVGLVCPDWLEAASVEELYSGMDAACRRWDLRLVGGDLSAGEQLSVALTALGEVEPDAAVRRARAHAGDAVVVIGGLGAAAAGLAQHTAGVTPHGELLAAHRRPQALVAAGQVLARSGATAMIDVSDGFGLDLGRLCAASGLAARVSAEQLPIPDALPGAAAALGLDVWDLVCGGGEDFALVATLPPGRATAAAAEAGDAEGVPAAVVGVVAETADGSSVRLDFVDGGEREISGVGYLHGSRGSTTGR